MSSLKMLLSINFGINLRSPDTNLSDLKEFGRNIKWNDPLKNDQLQKS